MSSDARLHVNLIHFLACSAVFLQLRGNSTLSKSKFHHQTCSKFTSTMPLSHAKSTATLLKCHSVLRTWKYRDSHTQSTHVLLNIITVRLEKLFPFCYRCTFLKRCDRLRSVPFYYRSPFRFIAVLRFVLLPFSVSFLLPPAFKWYRLAFVFKHM